MKTMFITVLILFVLVINVIDGHSCISEDIIEISLDELTHEKFQEEMNDIVSSDYDDNIVCGIIITVDYTTNELTIEFDPGLSSAPMGHINYSVILYTTFNRAPDQMHTSELLISCSSEDNCDEKFLTMDDHYQWWWLIDAVNHTEIEQMFKKLFISEESTPSAVQCYDAATIIPCSSKVCLLRTINWNDPYQTCYTNTQGKLYLIIQTQIMIKSQTNKLIHAVDYTCQFDLCNDRSILVQVNNITDIHYHVLGWAKSSATLAKENSFAMLQNFLPNLISSMLRVFTRKPIIEPSTTSILIQSTKEVNSTGDRLKVSIKLISLIFQICALLLL
jgi:hypothetical protein